MNSYELVLKLLGSKFSPVIKNTVFFDSFLGQYSDNPKYVSEELHRIMPEAQIVWSVSDKSKETPPDYVHTVRYASKEYYKYALNSEAVVDNHMGIRTFGFRNFNSQILKWLLKKPGQLAVATWHGTPLKKIGKDQLHRPAKTFFTNIDYCVYGCDVTRDAVGGAFFVTECMRPYGTPRNDRLVKRPDDKEIVALKVKLKLPIDKSVILFAPTFRKDIELSGLKQVKDLDIANLLLNLKNKFGKEYVFVFRAHHSVLEILRNTEDFDMDNIIDGNIGDDMTEYMECADILLTDYSSSMFDFALTDKPCFLYVPDLDHYREDERGMYLDFDSLPFPSGIDREGFYSAINTFDSNKYIQDKNAFLVSINNIENGDAAYLIARDIANHLLGEK